LVKYKGTAFRAKVNSNFPYPIETRFRLILSETQWNVIRFAGWDYPEIWGPVRIPANARNYEVMLPIIPDWQRDMNVSATNPAGLMRYGCTGGVCRPDIRVLPKPIADSLSFSVEIDPTNQIRETNEGNNMMTSSNYEVVTTRGWKFLFVPYRDNGCAPHRDFVLSGAKRQIEYLLATFPIADGKIEYGFAATPYSQRCSHDPNLTCEYTRAFNVPRADFLRWIARLAEEEGYDFGVAIGCGGGGGASGGSISAVFIGDSGLEEVLAHEFNHVVVPMDDVYSLDCYCSWEESYCELPSGDRFYCCWRHYNNEKRERRDRGIDPKQGCIVDCGQDWNECDANCCRTRCAANCTAAGGTLYGCPDGRPSARGMLPAANGFWVNKWIKKEGKQYFMDGPSGDNWMTLNTMEEEGMPSCLGASGVDRDGYLRLINSNKFKNPRDPEGLLVSGKINKNGTAAFDPFIYLPNTTLDIEPGGEGDYYLVLLDEKGGVLSKSGFEVSFYMPDPYGGPVDETGFVYRIEWKEGTKKIELQDKNGTVLASREVSANKPEIKVLYPNGGEVFAKGGKIKIKWEASDKDGDILSYSLAISTNGGETWLPIDIDITGNEYELDTVALEEGQNYLIRVRGTDGVNTAEDVSDKTFSVKLAKEFPTQYLYLITSAIIIIIVVVSVLLIKRRKGQS